MRRAAPFLALALLGALWAGGAAAQVRRLEVLGVAPIDADAPPKGSLRSAARRAALGDAVLRLAREIVGGVEPGSEAEAALAVALGEDPGVFASGFRLLEDRGEQPGLLLPGVETERAYVVLVEVQVDSERLRAHLREAGWAPAGDPLEAGGGSVRVILEGIESYRTYAALRQILEQDRRTRAAVPESFEPGRVVLRVDTDRRPRRLLDDLLRAAPPDLDLILLPSDPGTLRLRAFDRRRQEPDPSD